jgi:ribosome biogenesis GTPase A
LSAFEQRLDAAIAACARVPAVAERAAQLAALKDSRGSDALQIGVVGITSSGKSTFINAIMGDAILPEESRATTNLLVRCKAGRQRKVTVKYRDGRTETWQGAEVTRERMALISSERLNPENRAGVVLLEWTSPRSVLPEGLVLVDTPGLDAFGYKAHEDLTLRQFLPLADIVIYMTSIRNPFKASDLKLVEAIVENDQRVLFVLSQADLETDSYQGGRIWKTRQEKLETHLRRLADDINRHTRLKTFGIELVSSRLAKSAEGDRSKPDWASSRFDRVLDHFRRLRDDLHHLVIENRQARFVAVVGRAVADLEMLAKQSEHPVGPTAPERDRKTRLDKLESDVATLLALKSRIHAQWAERLEPTRYSSGLKQRFSGIRALEKAQEIRNRLQSDCTELWDSMTREMDTFQGAARAALDRAGVQPARSAAVRRMMRLDELPDPTEHVTVESKEVRVRDWWDCWYKPWPKSETRLFKIFHPDEYLDALQKTARVNADVQMRHLEWWSSYSDEVYLDPLRKERDQEQIAYEALVTARARSEHESDTANAALDTLRRLLAAPDETAVPMQLASPLLETKARQPEPEIPAGGSSGPQSWQALFPVLAAFRESSFKRRLGLFLGRLGANGVASTILLLGADRRNHLRLLSLLQHDLGMEDALAVSRPTDWLVAGSLPSSHILPGAARVLSAADGPLAPYTFVVAPEDPCLPKDGSVNWGRLVGSFDLVAVELDAPRISAGLSDLARAPYAATLAASRPRMFFTCGDGAKFATRLSHLVDDLPGELARHGLDDIPWFMFEDYDTRFLDFVTLASEVGQRNGSPQELVRRWQAHDLALSPPFTRESLLQAMIEVLGTAESAEAT